MYMYSFFCFPHILLKVKSVLNLLAHPAVAYPGFHVAKRQEVLPLPPECDDSPLQGYPPAFHQVSVTIRRYPFILLSEEKHWGLSVQPKNTTHWAGTGLEPRPLDPESSALTTGQCVFHSSLIISNINCLFSIFRDFSSSVVFTLFWRS